MRERHLQDLAAETVSNFPFAGFLKVTDASGNRHRVQLRDADVWLHANQGTTAALRIPLNGGFAYFPDRDTPPGPPIPILGAKALHTAGLKLESDYRQLEFSIQQIP